MGSGRRIRDPASSCRARERHGLARVLCLLLVWAAAASSAGAASPTVIVLSWDGVRHDYLERTELPSLQRAMREGARAERMIPVFPTNTFPNHVALATGTYADRHGIVNNSFIDRERGVYDHSNDASWIRAEPLWVAAERQGVPAAVFFWVGSETDWHGMGASQRMAPFDGAVAESAKVDQILAWLDQPEPQRPHLIMAWWHGADAVGHRKGPDDPGVEKALREQDRQLGRLLAGLDARRAWGDTTLLVVSDHGMAEVHEIVDVEGPLEAAGIGAEVHPVAATAHVYLKDPADSIRAEAVLRGIEGVEVYRGGALPERLRANDLTRSGDFVLLTEPPRTFYRPTGWTGLLVRLQSWLGTPRYGMHGYDPERPDMGAIFLALGRGVPPGARPGVVRSIDVAPTVAGLLGIDPPRDAEGHPIAGLDY
jgi:predicted AlkP superfamily pyrophosphatase or phosphodiesterase